MPTSYSDSLTDAFSGAAFIFIGFGVNFFVSFVFKILIARYLGVTGFGVFSLGSTIVALSAVALLGLDRGIARFLPREDGLEYKRGVLLSGLLIGIPMGFAVGLIIIHFSGTIAAQIFGSRESSAIVQVFALGIPFSVLVRLSVGGTQGMQLSAPKVYINNLALPISRLVLAAAAVAFGLGSVGVAWAYTLAFIASGTLGLFFLIRRTPLLSNVSPHFHYRKLLRFSLPIMIVATANMLYTSIDNLMIGYFVGAHNVGIYNSAFSLARILLIALLSFTFMAMPIMSEFHSNEQRDEMRSIYQTISKWIYILSFPIAFVFLLTPETIMRLIYGPGYGPGGIALGILTIGMLSHVIAGPNENTLISIGTTRMIMFDNISILFLNVILNVLLIPRFSYAGAAVASSISFIVLNLIYTVRLFLASGITPFPVSFLKLVLASVFVLISAKYMVVTTSETHAIIAVAAVGLLSYAGLVVYLGDFGDDELLIIKKIEERTGINLEYLKQRI